MFHGDERQNFRSRQLKFQFENFVHTHAVAVNLDVWKFPQMPVDHARRPLPDEKFPVVRDGERDDPPGGRLFAPAETGQIFDAVFRKRLAQFLHRTNQALRIARRANQRAEFHERLV